MHRKRKKQYIGKIFGKQTNKKQHQKRKRNIHNFIYILESIQFKVEETVVQLFTQKFLRIDKKNKRVTENLRIVLLFLLPKYNSIQIRNIYIFRFF